DAVVRVVAALEHDLGAAELHGLRAAAQDVVELLASLVPRLARLPHDVPDQDLSIPLHRVPTLPRSGYVMERVRLGASTAAG
ncbi:hypothetical protein ACWDNT_33830, partial [Streptomyces sp. NPDC000963]